MGYALFASYGRSVGFVLFAWCYSGVLLHKCLAYWYSDVYVHRCIRWRRQWACPIYIREYSQQSWPIIVGQFSECLCCQASYR